VMRLLQVPTPYPGELLYSVLARTLRNANCSSPKFGLEQLFCSRSVVVTPDLPTFLPRLHWLLSERWGMSLSESAMRMTTLPYYLAFRDSELRDRAVAQMVSGDTSLLLRLGVAAHRAVRPRALQYCPECRANDESRYAEAYWHTVHQLPGVWLCPEHGVEVVCSTVKLGGRYRHSFVAFDESVCSNETASGVPLDRGWRQTLLALARASLVALQDGDGFPPQWSVPLRFRARQAGYLGRNGFKAYELALHDYFSSRLLSRLGLPVSLDGDTGWQRARLRAQRSSASTLQILLLHIFFDAQQSGSCAIARSPARERLSRREEIDDMQGRIEALAASGLSRRRIAGELGTAWKTVDRRLRDRPPVVRTDDATLADDRHAWEALERKHHGCGMKRLRMSAKALYARLYRKQHAWLIGRNTNPADRSQRTPVVDWAVRDAALALAVVVEAEALIRKSPPVRLSALRLQRGAGLLTPPPRSELKLPRTLAAIKAHAESVSCFQRRRALWHAQDLVGTQKLCVSLVQRAAGLKSAEPWLVQLVSEVAALHQRVEVER
ncbi:MAG: TniQ family protein, partial [Planctomycetales bacterium]|nr:TniQ family protein [Planctomycetales bacterium]